MNQVAVVVLNWNGWRDTLTCITSLQSISYPNFYLIVVDNGSTDGSQGHIESHFPDIKVLQTGSNLGFGGGCNAGIRQALAQGADYVWLINSDAKVDANALTEMLRVAEQDALIGAVGSVLYEMDKPARVQVWGGGTVNLWTGVSRHRLAPAMLDFISGASVLIRREAFEQVGLFDDRSFFMYWEDSDLGFRMRRAGWRLAVAEKSVVWHQLSASLGKGSRQLDAYFTCSAVRFLRRYSPVRRLSTFFLVCRMVVKRLACAEFGRVRSVLEGYRAA